jgi:hypothetical protein
MLDTFFSEAGKAFSFGGVGGSTAEVDMIIMLFGGRRAGFV